MLNLVLGAGVFSLLPIQIGTPPGIASLPAIYRSLEALRAENREKVSKKSSWAFRPRVSKKVPKKVEKSLKRHFLETFRGLFDLFGTFLRLWAGRPRKTFLRLFCGFRPGGPRDSCRWPAGTQTWNLHFAAPRKKFMCLISWVGKHAVR